MQRTRINWPWQPLYTYNPVTGCKRGCTWCYARRIHERFNPGVPFSDIVVHADRIGDLMPKKPSFIFIGSMSDIEYWPDDVVREILVRCRYNPEHTFLFLSKNPLSYHGVTWPDNTMQGLTMTLTQTAHCQAENMAEMRKHPRPFLSLEPLLGTLMVEIRDIQQVIVGIMTGPGAVPVRPEWVQSIKQNVPEEKIFWKQPEIAA